MKTPICTSPVALNFQTACSDMDVNQGRFQVNGKSGYILKPAFMREAGTEFDPITLTRGDWLQHKTFHLMVKYGDFHPAFRCTDAATRHPLVIRSYQHSSSPK